MTEEQEEFFCPECRKKMSKEDVEKDEYDQYLCGGCGAELTRLDGV